MSSEPVKNKKQVGVQGEWNDHLILLIVAVSAFALFIAAVATGQRDSVIIIPSSQHLDTEDDLRQ